MIAVKSVDVIKDALAGEWRNEFGSGMLISSLQDATVSANTIACAFSGEYRSSVRDQMEKNSEPLVGELRGMFHAVVNPGEAKGLWEKGEALVSWSVGWAMENGRGEVVLTQTSWAGQLLFAPDDARYEIHALWFLVGKTKFEDRWKSTNINQVRFWKV